MRPLRPLPLRALRGAITVEENAREAILAATRELLTAVIEANRLEASDVISAIFTATPDLTAAYPAEAARELGWTSAGLLCLQEMAVPGSLPRCLRVLVHCGADRPQSEMHHCYLRDAAALRPDLSPPLTSPHRCPSDDNPDSGAAPGVGQEPSP